MRGFRCRHIALSALLMVCIPLYAHTNDNDSTHTIDGVEINAISPSNDLRTLSPQFTISSTEFARLNISDITSALRRLPGITLRDYGGAGGMKTVSVRGLGSQHTGVALDGLLLPDAQSGQIDLQQFQLAEVSSLSLKVAGDGDIFQPARNLSRASVVSITTADSTANTLSFETGSWGYISPSARIGRKVGDVTFALQGGYTKAENDYPFTVQNGVATHREKRNNSALSQGNINASALWTIAPEMMLKSFVRVYDNDRELPGVVRLYINENDETLRDRGAMVQSQLTSRIGKSVWLKSALRWNWSEQQYHNGVPSGGIKSEHYIQREYYATSSLLYQPMKNVDVDYSLDVFHNSMTTTLQGNPNPKRTSWLQSLAGKWADNHFVAVAQVLNTNIESEHHLSPSFSASYKPWTSSNFMIRVSAKDIFRMPSMTELYYYHIGQQNLRPENTQQLNFGITHSVSAFGNRLSASLTADIYINKVEDKIVAIPYNMFIWRYMNVEKVVGRGLDATLNLGYDAQNMGKFLLAANYSLQRIGLRNSAVEAYEDNQIAYTPKHSGSATFSWLNRWLNVSATLTAASQQWTNNEHNGNALPAYREVGASLFRSFRITGKSMIEVALVAQNLLSYEYCLIAHYPMPERNVKLKITYKFK